MRETIKETITSLKDPKYGPKITSQPLKKVIWYWSKYFLLFSGLVFFIIFALIVYFLPQLPKLIDENFPDLEIGIKNKKLYTIPADPFRLTSPGSAFIIDTRDKPDDYGTYPVGFFAYRDHITIKDGKSQDQTLTYESLNEFSLNKSRVVTFLKQNRSRIASIAIPGGFILGLLIIGFLWLFRLSIISTWAIVVWLIAKIMKKKLSYLSACKLTIYGSVLPMIISFLFFMAPNSLISLLNLGLLFYFPVSWIKNLPD